MVDNGSRLPNACLETEIDLRTYRRWYQAGEVQEDLRPLAVRPEPANKLTEKERSAILDVCNAPEYASLPPTQIVPTLLDKGIYLGSESTFYRTLRKAGQVEQLYSNSTETGTGVGYHLLASSGERPALLSVPY